MAPKCKLLGSHVRIRKCCVLHTQQDTKKRQLYVRLVRKSDKVKQKRFKVYKLDALTALTIEKLVVDTNEILTDESVCCICWENYKDLKQTVFLMGCTHSICNDCHVNCRKHNRQWKEGYPNCPICREQIMQDEILVDKYILKSCLKDK